MRVRLAGITTSNDNARIYRYCGYNDVCCPQDVRDAITNCPADEELIFELNSGGGSVYSGFEMYSAIRGAGREVTAEVQSIAGSAMSVVMAACDKVLMSPVANVMIHRASARSEGNAQVLRQDVQMLDTVDESILTAYTEKAGDKTTRNQFAAMMRRETYMTAQEAIDCGLADGMIEYDEGDGTEPLDFVAATYTGEEMARVMDGLPPIEDLKRRMTEAGLNIDPEGEPGVQNTDAKERDESMEPKTLDQLMAEYPDQMNEVRTTAATAERERITAIYAQAMPGFDKLVEDAVNDPTKTAGDVAMAIIAEQKKQGTAYLAGAKDDAGKANEVPADSAPADEADDSKADAKSTVELWKKGGK